jgi:hypothetical protein
LMGKCIAMTGRVFGRLTVLGLAGVYGGHAKWRCRCECGGETVVYGSSLRQGEIRSCGCNIRPAKCKPPETSRFDGVSFFAPSKMWKAQIRDGGRFFYLGLYESEYEAACVYDAAAVALWGCKAMTNDRQGLLLKHQKKLPKNFHLPRWP